MATVAEQLLVAREAQSLTIYQVAEITKIRTDHIRALEEGDFNAFSAPVYIRGFVRTYASLLRLDVPRVMADLDEELGRTEKFHEPPPLVPQARGVMYFITLQLSKINWRIALIGGVALAVLAAAGMAWRAHGRKPVDPLANLPPAVYQSSQTGDTLPLPQSQPPPARHP